MIADFMYACDFARSRKAWLVVVVPPESYKAAQKALVAAANGHPFGGRTLALPDGGKVSLAQALDTVFVPAGQPFSVMFAGWGSTKSTQAKEMARWRTAAQGTVSRAA